MNLLGKQGSNVYNCIIRKQEHKSIIMLLWARELEP